MTPAQTLLRASTGLNLSRPVVDRAVGARMAHTAAASQEAYLEQITPAELAALVELVVVPESWFYRDQQAFHAAVEHLRTRLAGDSGRVVRILSLPCAGGEEPYTMAMACADAGLPRARCLIDAVDISPLNLRRAQAGIYGRNAFRSRELGFRERHFSAIGNEFRIKDDIRQQVRFKQGNVLELDLSRRSGYYDVIFCRNLLIYFDQPTTRAAIAKLDALLAPDGQLFVGYAEVPSLCQHGYTPLPHAQAFGLTRKAVASARPGPWSSPALPPLSGLPPLPPLAPSLPLLPLPPLPPAPPLSAPVARAMPAAPTAAPADLLAEAHRLADLGQLQQAEKKCHDHLAQSPQSAEAYFILGLLNELRQQPTLAEDCWKRCIYLQPDHYQALCHLALLAGANGDAAGAAALKARAARIFQRQQAS